MCRLPGAASSRGQTLNWLAATVATLLCSGKSNLQDEDVIITKQTYNAFYNTNLDHTLKGMGRDTVIICGTMTNYCCGASARDAFFRGYRVVFGSDINATDDPQLHEAELQTLRRGYALIMSCDEIIEAIND